jgi:Ca2+-binding RTX toxin-like protein
LASSIVSLSDGGWVITWSSVDSYGFDYISAHRYDSAGNPIGGDFSVNKNSDTHRTLTDRSIASLSDGGWVITYTISSGSAPGVYGQRYSSVGALVGQEFQTGTSSASQSSIVGLSDGGWLVTWVSPLPGFNKPSAVYGLHYNSSGIAIGGEFLVSAYASGGCQQPSITALQSGGWVIAYQLSRGSVASFDVGFSTYSSDGTRGQSEIISVRNQQHKPSVAALSDGGWVVTWQSDTQVGTSGTTGGARNGIYGQRYSGDGAAVGGQFKVSTYLDAMQGTPSVAALADGGWVITWVSKFQAANTYVTYCQRYNSTGNSIGGEVQVGPASQFDQANPSISALPDGGWVITWGSGDRIYSQRYDRYGLTEVTTSQLSYAVASPADFVAGHTLYGDASKITDFNGVESVAWQWQRSVDGGVTWAAISGATRIDYALKSTDVGGLVRIEATYLDRLGASHVLYGSPSTAVLPLDTTAPIVSSIAYGPNDGNLALGEAVTLTVTLSEAVIVRGTPTLALANGGIAYYVSGSGTGALTFSYAPTNDQYLTPSSTTDLVTGSLGALTGSITDLTGNFVTYKGFDNVNPTGTLAVDLTAPTAYSIRYGANDGALALGETVSLIVYFSELVNVSGGLTLSLANGGKAAYIGGSGSNTLTFSYTPESGQTSSDLGVNLPFPLFGSITDRAGNAFSAAGFSSEGFTGLNPPGILAVDVTAPAVLITDNASGATRDGVTYSLSFSETVIGLTADDFTISNGTLISISGSNKSYSLLVSLAKDVEGSLGVTLRASAVNDVAGNANAAISADAQPIDTKAPTILAINYGANDGVLTRGETVNLIVTLSEVVSVTGSGSIDLANGGRAYYVGGSGTDTLTYRYTADWPQDTTDLSTGNTSSNATIRDLAGNLLPENSFYNINPTGTLAVDVTAPTVTTFSPANGMMDVAVGANIVVTFSEVIARATGSIQIRSGSDTGTVIETFDAAASARVTLSGSTLTIDPTSDLLSNTLYFVTSDSSAINDMAGNSCIGINHYSFTTAAPTDTTPPTLTNCTYGANDGNLAIGETVTLTVTLSEAVNVTGTPTLALANGGTATYSGGTGTNALTFSYTPSAGQTTADLATASSGALIGTITDLVGNAVTAAGFNAINPSGTLAVDAAVPTVTITDATPGTATGNVTYTITFSETVTGLTTSDFSLTNGTIASLSGAGTRYTLVASPAAGTQGNMALALNAVAVTDAAGNPNAQFSANDQAIDTLAPTVTTFSPTDGLTGVALASNIVLTFSETIARGTGSIQIRSGSATGTVVETFNAATSPRLTVSGATLTIDPTNNLTGNTQYFVTFVSGTIKDAAGNAYAGTSSYDFKTLVPDVTAPTVTTFLPTDGLTGVAVGSNIVLTFSETIARGTGSIQIRSGSATGTVVETFGAAASARLTLSGSTLTIDPTNNLSASTQYFVTFASGTIKDTAGNAYAGTTTYDFTTQANTVTGTANADTLTGTAGIDVINGLGGNDIITGAGGTDILNGGEGSDIYVMALTAEHTAAEIADTGTSGTDEVRFTSTVASTLTLYAGDTGIETVTIGTGTAAAAVVNGTTVLNIDASLVANGLTLTGNAGANTMTGTAYADRISGGPGNDTLNGGPGTDTLNGGAGNDTLNGGAGSDTLIGGAGNDTLTGGNGADSFVFNFALSATTNKDTITDFTSGTDKIQLSKAVMAALGSTLGTLAAGQFWSGAGVTAGHDGDDRIAYNTTTGALYYDADGSGAGAAVQIALLGTSTHPSLLYTDLQIII